MLNKLRAASLMALTTIPFAVCTADAQSRPLPVYEVSRTLRAIKVDGKLDDAQWARAPVADLVLNGDGSPAPYKTEARILYDEKYLYFSFRSIDDNIWATRRRRDEHLWEEEVVEVFLQADPRASSSYIELEVNPLGAMLDIYLLDIRKPVRYESWNSEKLRWAIEVNGTVDGKGGDREWTCEIAFPVEDAVTAPHIPPRAGDRWRINLYRVEVRPQQALMAWSPTFKDDFHLPEMFGELVFTEKLVR